MYVNLVVTNNLWIIDQSRLLAWYEIFLPFDFLFFFNADSLGWNGILFWRSSWTSPFTEWFSIRSLSKIGHRSRHPTRPSRNVSSMSAMQSLDLISKKVFQLCCVIFVTSVIWVNVFILLLDVTNPRIKPEGVDDIKFITILLLSGLKGFTHLVSLSLWCHILSCVHQLVSTEMLRSPLFELEQIYTVSLFEHFVPPHLSPFLSWNACLKSEGAE